MTWNAFRDALDRYGDEVAGVLVEPIVGNFGIVEPAVVSWKK